MSLFYLCTEIDCNKKYKTSNKLVDHLLKVHKKIIEEKELSAPEEISKNNRKEVENKRNRKVNNDNQNKLREEIKKQEELTQLAKARAEQEYLQKYQSLHELKLEAEKLKLEFEIVCKRNVIDSSECCICTVEPRNTVIIPCGHKYFCKTCITNYHNQNPTNRCPICRSVIQSIHEVFE